MYQLVAVLILISSILCQNILLSIDEHNKNLNNQKCENKSGWALVEYENIGIISESSTVLRANKESCTCIPIFLILGSTLQCKVYVKTVFENSGLVIAVYLGDNEFVTKWSYNGADKNFEGGWKEISLNIEKRGVGYINLLGYSRDNEMVLIESVRYKFNTTRTDVNTDKGFIDEEFYIEKFVEKDYLQNNNSNEEELKNNFRARTIFRDDNNSNGLGSWAIALIVLGSITVTGLVAVSAYHIGKMVASAKYPPVLFDSEPPNVEIIPRVRGTVDNPVHEYI